MIRRVGGMLKSRFNLLEASWWLLAFGNAFTGGKVNQSNRTDVQTLILPWHASRQRLLSTVSPISIIAL
ncbi:uncharacterized protein HKW66_Vig0217870 [Vigna angularis]|uniref:Secreted protein n=1 Tax=Phaseolus angularis TaxID=3914 RepID=A0A8T0JI20_PHAAN|nr:uncharacterized protein HKW66_Vig0217870 [Vigna angularis]